MKHKAKKKCGTCYGYGLWGIGDPAPIGPMDASDGVPALPCPECGADNGTTPSREKGRKR